MEIHVPLDEQPKCFSGDQLDLMKPDLLRGIAVFTEVARLKSVSRAAAALEMPKSTVSRRVSMLEAEVGLRLLKRTTKKIELTDEGLAYFAQCQQILEAVENAHEGLLGSRIEPSGHLRVAMTPDFALRLVKTLPAFRARHPRMLLEFDLTARRVDPLSEQCDIAIHVGQLADSGLTAYKLTDVVLQLYAAPSYLAGRGPIATPHDLSEHACIVARPHAGEALATWDLHRGRERLLVKVESGLVLNSIGVIQRLAIAGAGIALLPEDLCRDEVAAGRLALVLDGWRSTALPIHALTATRFLPARTRVFLDYLRDALGQV
ncbi:MAG: LysR family transcriptional regulator [Comamonadaceae bacterium]|nr:MAG: LysR family transcriptional regulator [Comamonadaceae bacterium]